MKDKLSFLFTFNINLEYLPCFPLGITLQPDHNIISRCVLYDPLKVFKAEPEKFIIKNIPSVVPPNIIISNFLNNDLN
jgi:hypothetical protein